MHIHLARDPWDKGRVSAQSQPFDNRSYPRGPQGNGWELREVDVDDEVWTALLRAEHTPDEQDALHRQWWEQAQ